MGFTIQNLPQAVNNIPVFIGHTYRYASATPVVFFQFDLDLSDISVLHTTFTHRCDAGNTRIQLYIDSDAKFDTGGQVDSTEGYWATDTSAYSGIHTYTLYITTGGGATEGWLDELCIYRKL